jgi:hypothetical protein
VAWHHINRGLFLVIHEWSHRFVTDVCVAGWFLVLTSKNIAKFPSNAYHHCSFESFRFESFKFIHSNPLLLKMSPHRPRLESAELLRQALEEEDPSEEREEAEESNTSTSGLVEENDEVVLALADEACPPSAQDGSLAHFWNCWIQRTYMVVLFLMVLVLWPSGGWALKQLTHYKTDSTFHNPIPGSLSALAQEVSQQKFPNSYEDPMHPMLIVVLHSPSSLVNHTYARTSSLHLQDYLQNVVSDDANNISIRVSS